MTTALTDITMPQLSDQMEEGTIVSWLVEDGQEVAAGDEVVEVETDKATATHVTEVAGHIQIVAEVGATLAVGEVIARVGPPGETDEPEPEAEPKAEADASAESADKPRSNGAGQPQRVTPLARRAAGMHDISLDTVKGSGPGGRVMKADVLRAAGVEPDPAPDEPPVAPKPQAPSAAPTDAAPAANRQTPTRLQKVVAKRMAEVNATVPHFQVQTEVAMNDALALRAQIKAAADGGIAPSVNDIIVKACALALLEHPLVNGSFRDGEFELHDQVNVGIAVASDDGLVVATIHDTDLKSLGRIAKDSRGVAGRVRDGKATPVDLGGSTFTVSNLGMFGMTAITPLINPPHAAILGVGATRTVLARGEDDTIVDQQLLTLTLSCDHRILNGADGSRFLFDVKQLLETPLRLAL